MATSFGNCSICASAFTFDDISALKCGHTFHGECINKWIQQAKNCPKCRTENSLKDIIKLFVDDGPINIPVSTILGTISIHEDMPQMAHSEQQSPGPGPSNSSAGMQMFGPSQAAEGPNVNSLLDGYIPNLWPSTNDGTKTKYLPPSQRKYWHASLTTDLRNHLIGKLFYAILLSADPAAIDDQRFKDLQTYARNVEKDIFKLAADKEAYYHMLAESINKIQKEFQEKKNHRLNELLQQQQHHPPSE